MAESASRSPSPVSAPPVAAFPGPRAAKLIRLYNDAVSHTLKTCSYDNFAACFPTTAEAVPEALQGLHSDFVKRLEEHCQAEFETILRERNAIPALNDLDRLLEDARKRKVAAEEQSKGGPVRAPAAPHTLPARALYLAHLGPSIEQHQKSLREQLERMQEENADLVETLLQQRREIAAGVGAVEAVIGDINGSLELVPADKMQDLTKEAVEMDSEMRIAG